MLEVLSVYQPNGNLYPVLLFQLRSHHFIGSKFLNILMVPVRLIHFISSPRTHIYTNLTLPYNYKDGWPANLKIKLDIWCILFGYGHVMISIFVSNENT